MAQSKTSNASNAGSLFIVPTPIGNLEDITLRALRILKEADVILAEDTRTSKRLLTHYDINTPLRSHHAHNEHAGVEAVISQLKAGQTVALISDAGTPGISDPGFLLSRACAKEGLHVECLPGATALIPAIVASGLPCDAFHFEGFLPHKKGRQTRHKYLATLEQTFVMYESPFRIVKCLEELAEFCGADRQVSVSRELTKMFEETVRGTVAEALAHFQKKDPKGEFVVVVAGKPAEKNKRTQREEVED